MHTMTGFTATLVPHGANPDALARTSWDIQAADRPSALRQAMDLAGAAIGESDFGYRDLADGSLSILDTVGARFKIATLKLRETAAPRSALAKAA
jgi:hypothetical protein